MNTFYDKLFSIECGRPYPLGATYIGDDKVNFSVAIKMGKSCGVILYNLKSGKEYRIPFKRENKIGDVYCMLVAGINPDLYDYNFFNDSEIVNDPYSKLIRGNEKWGAVPGLLRSGIYNNSYNWGDDTKPQNTYGDSIFYNLHIRGFSKHKSSGVNNPGTFEGLMQKAEYIKELGITAVEIMPAYNFVEFELPAKSSVEFDREPYEPIEPKLNYWGYKNGFYFAPKQSYGAIKHKEDVSFKNMVKELHKQGIELIMQFFFPEQISFGYIVEVLRFWMLEYHVDGFHLYGLKLPLSMIGTDPVLSCTKILCDNIPTDDIYDAGYKPEYINMATCNETYMYDMRRFLKSDEGMVGRVLDYIKSVPVKCSNVHYYTHGNTFTLADLVSYDRKHNEPNGENNRDGAIYNGSWNCGAEGSTSKKSIKKLRLKQIKNAIILNMLSKSAPLITAGDEFGNSQKGNNNPYCIDSTVTWLNWKDIDKNNDIFMFMKDMIAFRMNHKIFRQVESFRMNDYKQLGIPDLSLHSEEPWCVDTDPLSRQFGLLYNCNYAGEDCYIYVAVNLHWTSHSFAIPKLGSLYEWSVFKYTEDTAYDVSTVNTTNSVTINERSIMILTACRKK